MAGGWWLVTGERPAATSRQPPATVGDVSEVELIGRIQQRLPPQPPWLLVGIGDDAAVVEPERNRAEVLSVDCFVDGIHFDRAFVPPEAVGHRAMAANLSDLAAMGAAPRLALVSLALPCDLPLADFDAVADGFTALASRHRMHIAGGNLTRTTGPLTIDITVVGTVKRRQALTRGGARCGDELYVTGTIGAAAVGLQQLRQHRSSTAADTEVHRGHGDEESRRPPSNTVSSVANSCVERYLRPEPRVRVGTLLARNRAAGACIDTSDGLADAIRQLTNASGVGASIDVAALPIDRAAREWFAARGSDPAVEAMGASDDYELLIAVPPKSRRRLDAVRRHAGVPLTRIGVCTDDRAITPPLPAGFTHFR